MSWFAAHIIMYIKLKDKRQRRYPVWENIVLIEAASEQEAWAKAKERGRVEEGDDDGTFRWGDQPATWVFAGVRKLVDCVDPQTPPADGTEISYSQLELDSREAVEKLAAGKDVAVRYREEFGPEVQVPPKTPSSPKSRKRA